MGNLQTGIPGPPATAPPPPTALLRKVQSESNLLKIKNKRDRTNAGAPYLRVFNNQLQLVPESSVISGSEASTPSPISNNSNSTPPTATTTTKLLTPIPKDPKIIIYLVKWPHRDL